MGLQLKRTPVVATRFLLASVVVTLSLASPLVGIIAGKIAAADGTPDTSKIKFVGGPWYVAENTPGELAAQLTTYASTTSVNFVVDGKTDDPIAGVDHGGKNFHHWRLFTALEAGKHTITAQVLINGDWYDASGSATVYSIDAPTTNYDFPNSNRHIFRSSDNPVRVTIDDEFDQFRDITFGLFSYDTDKGKVGKRIGVFKEPRANCDLTAAGEYLRCDLDKADGWTALPEGVYAVKLATTTQAGGGVRASTQDFVQFTVDDTKPVLSDLQIDGSTTVKDWLTVSAKASDAINLESVDFYVTQPGSDGTCTGDGAKLAEHRSVAVNPADGRYHATLDVSGVDAAGKDSAPYCVTAVARDEALNESDSSSLPFAVDHMAPLVTLRVASSLTPSASTPVTLGGTVDGKATLALLRDGAQIPDFNLSMDGAGRWSFTLGEGLEKGGHLLKIVATDPYGNSSTETTSPQSYANLTVGAYIPPKEQSLLPTALAPPKLPPAPIVPAPSIAQLIASQHRQAVAQAPKDNDEAILGAETTKQSDSGAVIAPSARGWTFFGIAWYWWLLALGAVSAAALRVVARVRRSSSILPA